MPILTHILILSKAADALDKAGVYFLDHILLRESESIAATLLGVPKAVRYFKVVGLPEVRVGVTCVAAFCSSIYV
jgi:hypothetical protein